MPGTTTDAEGFTKQERAAMKERAKELRDEKRRGRAADKAAQDEAALLARIAEMTPIDRSTAERFHELVRANAPDLAPKLWYGMPAYTRDGEVVCFFQDAAKFKARYATIGFSDAARLDDGNLWPTSFAVTSIGKAEEKRIVELVLRAVA